MVLEISQERLKMVRGNVPVGDEHNGIRNSMLTAHWCKR
jgi:hypothetical protein